MQSATFRKPVDEPVREIEQYQSGSEPRPVAEVADDSQEAGAPERSESIPRHPRAHGKKQSRNNQPHASADDAVQQTDRHSRWKVQELRETDSHAFDPIIDVSQRQFEGDENDKPKPCRQARQRYGLWQP